MLPLYSGAPCVYVGSAAAAVLCLRSECPIYRLWAAGSSRPQNRNAAAAPNHGFRVGATPSRFRSRRTSLFAPLPPSVYSRSFFPVAGHSLVFLVLLRISRIVFCVPSSHPFFFFYFHLGLAYTPICRAAAVLISPPSLLLLLLQRVLPGASPLRVTVAASISGVDPAHLRVGDAGAAVVRSKW